MNGKHEWIKSSYSDGEGGQCVEWAPVLASGGSVPVRDSKDLSRAPLSFSADAWSSFVSAVRGDGFRG
ncbi:DUF397 domain-containing protein [Streptomyces sp. HNM0574]|uniref:DUF397 domain-containing protein n=1 Tax=Streptomyces sp. HNM0574 TaxID=2714954 RepID=UPI00146CD46A|nr:DUF397 domain-containing protein [Streptomyces sp. HNM0574]NLU66702.1 DUF397 domain-containing protein [Streptomyces sp. HNM0574]